jgi:hypothetical protein
MLCSAVPLLVLRVQIVRLKGSSANNKEAVLLALAARSFNGGRTIVFCKCVWLTAAVCLSCQLACAVKACCRCTRLMQLCNVVPGWSLAAQLLLSVLLTHHAVLCCVTLSPIQRTKQRAHRLKILFGLCELPPAAELHGDMTQAARLSSLERFRKGEVAFLLCTDVAARGLDIIGVQVRAAGVLVC